jgi:hypothetical protein
MSWFQMLLNRLNLSRKPVLTITATSSNPGLIPTPTVQYTSPNVTGTLTFTPVANASGKARLSVTVSDHQNTPITRSFTVTVVAGSLNPTIVVTAPTPNAAFSAPAMIDLAASVTANGHNISKVQFFVGTSLAGEDDSAPYSVKWAAEATGSYSLVARAIFDSSSSVDSPALMVNLSTLPAPWLTADIGNVSTPGSATVKNDVFTLQGAGEVGGTADGLRFAYQPMTADGEIQARLIEPPQTGQSARGGIMIRESLGTDSRMIFLAKSPDGVLHLQTRSHTGGLVASQVIAGGNSATWLRLVRKSNLLVAFYGNAPGQWSMGYIASISMAPNVLVGLAVASGEASTLDSSSFEAQMVVP